MADNITGLVFDRIYPTLDIANANIALDDIYLGRYILIDSTNPNAIAYTDGSQYLNSANVALVLSSAGALTDLSSVLPLQNGRQIIVKGTDGKFYRHICSGGAYNLDNTFTGLTSLPVYNNGDIYQKRYDNSSNSYSYVRIGKLGLENVIADLYYRKDVLQNAVAQSADSSDTYKYQIADDGIFKINSTGLTWEATTLGAQLNLIRTNLDTLNSTTALKASLSTYIQGGIDGMYRINSATNGFEKYVTDHWTETKVGDELTGHDTRLKAIESVYITSAVTSLSNFYTKDEVSAYVGETMAAAGAFDINSYYNKTDTDQRIASAISTYLPLEQTAEILSASTIPMVGYYYVNDGTFSRVDTQGTTTATTVGAELRSAFVGIEGLRDLLRDILFKNITDQRYNTDVPNLLPAADEFYLSSPDFGYLLRGVAGSESPTPTTVGDELTGLLTATKNLSASIGPTYEINIGNDVYPQYKVNQNRFQAKHNSADEAFTNATIAEELLTLFSKVVTGTADSTLLNTERSYISRLQIPGLGDLPVGGFQTFNTELVEADVYFKTTDDFDVTTSSGIAFQLSGFSSWANSIHLVGQGFLNITEDSTRFWLLPEANSVSKLCKLPSIAGAVGTASAICGIASLRNAATYTTTYHNVWLAKYGTAENELMGLVIQGLTSAMTGNTYNFNIEVNYNATANSSSSS